MSNSQPIRRPQQNRKNNGRKKKSKAPIIIVVILLIAVIAGIVYFMLQKEKPVVDDGLDTPKPPVTNSDRDREKVVGKISYKDMMKSMEEFKTINPDTKGMLVIPGTNINEPVVHYYDAEAGNEYYLARDFSGTLHEQLLGGGSYSYWKETRIETPIYADINNTFDAMGDSETAKSDINRNYVLYGHNWTNFTPPVDVGGDNDHVMFGQIPSFSDLNFATENQYIYFSTGDHEMVWRIYAVFYSEEDWKNAAGLVANYNAVGPTDENFATMIAEHKARSMFDYDVEVDITDSILTLSTCSRVVEGAGDQQRFVVVARMLRDGETDKDKVAISENTDAKQPMF